jgi:hypothetical protein
MENSPMKLEGSCHCRKVTFTVEADAPVPFNRCYCSICRKTAGTGGFAINLGAKNDTLVIKGEENLSWFHAMIRENGEEKQSEAKRYFCKHCGTALWLYSDKWPDLVHPHAGCIDTDLPEPPFTDHNMIKSKPDWVRVCAYDDDRVFDEFGPDSLKEWHEKYA